MNLRTALELVPAPVQPFLRLPARGLRELYYRARDVSARPHPEPVFVLGNQKSGTTAIAALLGMATDLPTTLDLRRETQNDFYPRITRGEVTFGAFLRRNGLDFSRKIVKEPNLTFFVGELRAHFPRARFVFVLRDPRDNIRSILNRVHIPGDLAALTPDRREHVDPGFALVLDGRWLGIDAGEHYIDRLAARWNACLQVYEPEPEAMQLVRYEDFVSDKAGAIARLSERLGLPLRRDIADRVDQQFQMRGDRRVQPSDFFGPNLGRIESLCGEGMERFGYARLAGAGAA